VYPDEAIVGAGDVADCTNGGSVQTAKLLDGISGTIFMLGDGAYPQGSPESYADCYGPTWGRHVTRTRPVPGNHDYDEPGAAGFLGFFAGQLGDTGRTYYRYRLGAWMLYALDSSIDATEGSEQYRWLATELAANPNACTLAYWHYAVLTSSRSGGADEMHAVWRLLADQRADVVLAAHDHVYERFAPMNRSFGFDPNGIRQFVAGTGGGRLYSFVDIKPLSEARTAEWGVLKLVLSNDGYSWEFIPVAAGGMRDSGQGTCSPFGATARR
jgi:acid phosphatase type 7